MLPRKDSSDYNGTATHTHQAGAYSIAVILVTNWIVQLKITDVNMHIFTCKITWKNIHKSLKKSFRAQFRLKLNKSDPKIRMT